MEVVSIFDHHLTILSFIYDAKFLNAADFAFAPKKEQLQAILSVVTRNELFVKAATGLGKSVCYITFLMFVITSCDLKMLLNKVL